ncbi:MAG TPA: lysophospholipase [Acidimicrobiia bacterium]|nr:lysophospholipase [Acidimicrobiia bacterium]
MPVTSVAEPRRHPVVGSQLVRRWGPEDDPVAEIVLVHGIAEHSGRYERTGNLLAEAGFGVTSADLIGFGATGGRRGDVADWAHFLDQIQVLVEEARQTGRPTVLMGHSMGGLLALEYVLSERPGPDLLVLSAPGLEGGAAWQRAAAPILGRLVPRLRIPNALKGEQLSRDPAVGASYFADPLVLTATCTRLGAALFAAMERTRSAVTGLEMPTLVIHGGLDTIVPPTATVELGQLPTVQRRLYPTLRHELLNEPEGPAIVSEIAEWIRAGLGSGEVDD